MTKNQEKFLKILYKYGNMNSEQCCKKLKLEKRYEYSSYYGELCSFLPYPNESDEFDEKVNLRMYPLEEDPLNEKGIFSLTVEGENYFKIQSKEKKSNCYNRWQITIGIGALIVAIISALIGMHKFPI